MLLILQTGLQMQRHCHGDIDNSTACTKVIVYRLASQDARQRDIMATNSKGAA